MVSINRKYKNLLYLYKAKHFPIQYIKLAYVRESFRASFVEFATCLNWDKKLYTYCTFIIIILLPSIWCNPPKSDTLLQFRLRGCLARASMSTSTYFFFLLLNEKGIHHVSTDAHHHHYYHSMDESIIMSSTHMIVICRIYGRCCARRNRCCGCTHATKINHTHILNCAQVLNLITASRVHVYY